MRGNIFLYSDCITQLEAFCAHLGFADVPAITALEAGQKDILSAVVKQYRTPTDTVTLLTSRLPYEPSWGGYGGLPRPVLLEQAEFSEEPTTSHYIAPFLLSYQRACRRILLGRWVDGRAVVTVPVALLPGSTKGQSDGIQVILEKCIDSDAGGIFSPLDISGPYHTFAAGKNLRTAVEQAGFSWPVNRAMPIGSLLSSELFTCTSATATTGNNRFRDVLFPVMKKIITDKTPQLCAGEFFLQKILHNCINELELLRTTAGKNLLIAALYIDMRGFGRPVNEHYLMPWQAFLRQGDKQKSYSQQDLLMAMLAEKRHSSASFPAYPLSH